MNRLLLFKSCRKNVFSRQPVSAVRWYHSDNGVFGYRPKKPQHNFESNLEEIYRSKIKESNFARLVDAYRRHGHKVASVNPIELYEKTSKISELDPKLYGFKNESIVNFQGILNSPSENGTISEAINQLNQAYTEKISAEFMHLEDEVEIEWFSKNMEQLPQIKLDETTRKNIAVELIKSQAFDHFLANKFPGVKRYGGEGAESMMAFFREFFRLSSQDGVEQIVIAMAHRGRLNLLTGMLHFPPTQMFAKLRGLPDFPDKFKGTGDVLSHCISSVDLEYENDKKVHVTLLYNPSHLEAVNPVSMGKTRAKYLCQRTGEYSNESTDSKRIINLQVHGDAALSGQGINQECLALSRNPHFEVGGSVHLVVNNQLGFTTPALRGRSSKYCTDVGKMVSAPSIHVNGDFPDEVHKATKLAFEYQKLFGKDIFLDINCYRQWGHNELDDPTFTNPLQYSVIRNRKTVPDKYTETLINENLITQKEVDSIAQEHNDWLNDQLKAVDHYQPEDPCFKKQWSGFSQAQNVVSTWETGISKDLQKFIGEKSVSHPENFNLHPTLKKNYVSNRLKRLENGTNIDWATAEAIAIGSLLYQGYNVRISGQDVGRATFSHRHAMLVDQKTNNICIPLNALDPNQTGNLEIANSILSEEAVLGFEYGMSIEHPNNFIIWEAQFGDFFNGAQIIFDTFISSGEAKWLWSSGLTILLPHGYDGAGPEHSSARIERFLQLTDSKEDRPDGDDINMQVCQPSTPAQYFHLLRRQMIRNYRKPLVIIAPKTLLRLSDCTSSYQEMSEGTSFRPVLGDSQVNPQLVRKVIIASGKHYYTLLDKRKSMNIKDTALVRLESFCPFPTMELQEELAKYTSAQTFIWSQEEPRNMGAWTFCKPRFENLVGRQIHYAGRDTLPTPAVGVAKYHQEQVQEIALRPFTM